MEPTLPAGSRVWVNPLAYLIARPVRGDVVIVCSPAKSDRLELKRVIGLPGEEIAWSQGAFRINGAALQEPYAGTAPAPPGDDEVGRCRLGPRQYFVAGDNRLYGTDSRIYGPVDRAAIVGRVL